MGRFRRKMSWLATMALVAGSGVVGLAASSSAQAATPFAVGDVLAAVGNGQVRDFAPNGTLKATLTDGTSAQYTAGMCFDSSSNLYVTNFNDNSISKFSSSGTLISARIGTGYNADPESCSFNKSNQFYVGEADGNATVLKESTSGGLLASYNPARDARGTDWVDLSADQSTLFYTSEGSLIKRFDVANNTQLSDFASGLPAPCYALRQRLNGEVLVACSTVVERLSPSGSILQTYTGLGAGQLFALNIDPDGTSFWTADLGTGQIYHVDIATGHVIAQFSGQPNTVVGGLAVVGEQTTGNPTGCQQAGSGMSADSANGPVTFTAKLSSDTTKTQGFDLKYPSSLANHFTLTSLTSAKCIDDPKITPGQGQKYDTFSANGTGTFNSKAGYTIHFELKDAGESSSGSGAGLDSVQAFIYPPGSSTPLVHLDGKVLSGNLNATDGS